MNNARAPAGKAKPSQLHYAYGLSLVAIGLCGVFCVYRLKHVHYKRRMMHFYRQNREFRNVALERMAGNEAQHTRAHAQLRVMTYNILADGARWSLNAFYNEYTPLKYRKWNYRRQHLLFEIEAYGCPDIIALNETTYTTYHNSLSLDLSLMGYESIHAIRNQHGHKCGLNTTTETVAYKKDKFEVLNTKIIRFNEECSKAEYDQYFGDQQSGFRGKRLKQCPDILVVLHLRLRQRTDSQFIVCSTHLHWDPRSPHIKLAQALMLNKSLYRLLVNEWHLDIDTLPLICCGDFNSLPLKTKPDEFDPNLSEPFVPAVYQLMTQSFVSTQHAQHPKRRIYEKVYRSIYYEQHPEILSQLESLKNESHPRDEDKIMQIKRDIDIEQLANTVADEQQYPQLRQLQFINDIQDYTTELQWKSCMHTAGKEPPFTNYTPTFQGTLDYIFCNDKLRVLSYLDHPKEIQFMPNANYVSDHLRYDMDVFLYCMHYAEAYIHMITKNAQFGV